MKFANETLYWKSGILMTGIRDIKNIEHFSKFVPINRRMTSRFSWFYQNRKLGLRKVLTNCIFFTRFSIFFLDKHGETFCFYKSVIVCSTLHKKWSFPLRTSSANVTKSAVPCQLQAYIVYKVRISTGIQL